MWSTLTLCGTFCLTIRWLQINYSESPNPQQVHSTSWNNPMHFLEVQIQLPLFWHPPTVISVMIFFIHNISRFMFLVVILETSEFGPYIQINCDLQQIMLQNIYINARIQNIRNLFANISLKSFFDLCSKPQSMKYPLSSHIHYYSYLTSIVSIRQFN